MWEKSPRKIVLLPDQIHVWRVKLDIDSEEEKTLQRTLSKEENTRAERFHFPIHQSQFIVGRGFLRRLLGKYLSQAPENIKFKYGEQGKPDLADAQFKNFNFNLSHSDGYAIFAFAKSESLSYPSSSSEFLLGIDLELINPSIEVRDIALQFFSKRENEKLFALPYEKQVEAFFNCWTRKEALIKAIGGGLSIPLDKFEMSLRPSEKAELVALDPALGNAEDWSVFSFFPKKNMVGALAVNRKEIEVYFYDVGAISA